MTSIVESNRAPLLVDFALQGGGAHGAFTWGVLDRLLEEPWLRIDGISGTSAGAMNAAVLVDGYVENGANGARAALEDFWRRVSRAALLSPLRRTPLDVLLGRWTLDHSPFFVAMDLMARLFSPTISAQVVQIPCATSLRRPPTSIGWRKQRSSSSSLQRTCAPGAAGCSEIARSRRTCYSRRRAFRRCFGPSRSMAKVIGTVVIPAIPPSRRWCGNVIRRTRFSFRSIRSSGRGCRARPATFSTGSTRSRSMPCC